MIYAGIFLMFFGYGFAEVAKRPLGNAFAVGMFAGGCYMVSLWINAQMGIF